jgi:hypothetical protein
MGQFSVVRRVLLDFFSMKKVLVSVWKKGRDSWSMSEFFSEWEEKVTALAWLSELQEW